MQSLLGKTPGDDSRGGALPCPGLCVLLRRPMGPFFSVSICLVLVQLSALLSCLVRALSPAWPHSLCFLHACLLVAMNAGRANNLCFFVYVLCPNSWRL